MIASTGDILIDAVIDVINIILQKPAYTNLNFQYGYIHELNVTLVQMEKDPARFENKFPLVWLAEPFTVEAGYEGIHGKSNFDLFIFNSTQTDWKAEQRVKQNFTTVIYPLYTEVLKAMVQSTAIEAVNEKSIRHSYRKGYYWDTEKKIFNDAVDCLQVSFKDINVFEKSLCTPQSF